MSYVLDWLVAVMSTVININTERKRTESHFEWQSSLSG